MKGSLELKQQLLPGGKVHDASSWDSCYGALEGSSLRLFLDEKMAVEVPDSKGSKKWTFEGWRQG
ncbi:Hypothetical predicted protein [Marmota monax]|uniref:Uncharacterized protein n=1 Tax=Marmota monax TaxID=9995 RepID=A0A5E4C0G1_MARMO|nr:hypothetical protein GHT09_006805 [Marmota monax]VTJ75026.1 Hypothetical predicted protein [Marmota monax]